MSVSSGDPEANSASTSARVPFLRLLPFALAALFAICAPALGLYLSSAAFMTASQVLAIGPGGPWWP
jgi:hypothetical protein